MMDIEATLQALVDRQQIVDTLYRYASTIDTKDFATLRSLFVDDAVGQYAGAEPIHGADAIVAWIDSMTVDRAWQHHLLNVYHVDVDGDEARTLTYHTSHQTTTADPDTVIVIVARYHDVLRKVEGTWKIADKRMDVGWMEERRAPQAAIAEREAAESSSARNGGER
jgi:ketosteroid isomerase-like protein